MRKTQTRLHRAANILRDFKELRGYDPTLWLPALTGVMVGDPARSDRFLWDFRRTIDELVARNHYGEIAEVAHSRSLVTYAEALESHRPWSAPSRSIQRSSHGLIRRQYSP